jgi:prepilin-type N-terminal cleavage/methylation domain-containing protein
MRFRPPHFRAAQSAFTLVEIAISLAVIGIALVAIIGVLPLGMNVQRDNREETVINQDATVFMNAVSHGARGLNDLTNYVYAITNYQTHYIGGVAQTPVNVWGYNYLGSSTIPSFPISSGTNIIGILSTPELTDNNDAPADSIYTMVNSNHIIAYIRSLSGAATEKPPQDNQIIQQDAFGYRLLCVNALAAAYPPPLWVSQKYNVGDNVSFIINGTTTTYWQAISVGTPSLPPQPGDVPNSSSRWVRINFQEKLAANLREVRLTFLWPVLPNGSVGNGRQTYRTAVAGQIIQTNDNGQPLYFFQSQSFTNAP